MALTAGAKSASRAMQFKKAPRHVNALFELDAHARLSSNATWCFE